MLTGSGKDRVLAPEAASGSNEQTKTSVLLVILLVACYFIFFFRMGARDLWNPDEPRYAQVAREMLETGEYVVPHLNGQVYTEKPPLYFWFVALVSKPFGDVTETTARFPSAMSATLAVLLTFFLGIKMLGRREAFMGALILATSAQFFSNGRLGVLDSLLTLCIFGSLVTFYVGYVEKNKMLYVVGFLFLAPAALTKGPVGIAVPVVVMFMFLFVENLLRKEDSGRQLAWFALGTVLGLMVVAVIVLPWLHAAYERSDGVYGSLSILAKQTKGRMFQSYSHRRPFYYYFRQILWQFLPWTVFFPLTVYAIKKKGDLERNVGLRFLVVWFLSTFLLFTCISGKRSQYLMPLMPAGGLLIGWALVKSNPVAGRLKDRRDFSIPFSLLIILSLVGMIATMVGAYLYFHDHFLLITFNVLAGFVALLALYREGRNHSAQAALKSLVVITVIIVAVLFGFIGPIIDYDKSARPFCNRVLAAMQEGDELFIFKACHPNIHFYMHQRLPVLKTSEEIKETLGHSERIFLIYRKKYEGLLGIEDPYEMEQVSQAKISSRDTACVAIHLAEGFSFGKSLGLRGERKVDVP